MSRISGRRFGTWGCAWAFPLGASHGREKGIRQVGIAPERSKRFIKEAVDDDE